MIFKKKKQEPGIFDDLPVFESHPSTQRQELKKRGRRAMLVPATAANPQIAADALATNTGKQREQWLEIIFESDLREGKQRAIAAFLEENYRVQKWWAASIALMYLEWREAPKTNTGSDSVLRVSKVLETSPGLAYNILISTSVYGEGFSRFLKQVQSERIVLTFQDETRATLILKPVEDVCEVLIEHEFIGNPVMLKARTKFWKDLFEQIAEQVKR
ncbi:MAG: hypothetical protein WCK24_04635 [Actinomycetes bacterium]